MSGMNKVNMEKNRMMLKNDEIKLTNKKLNYLVVMPRHVQNIGDGYSFPLGIPYISASIKNAGYKVFTINLNHHEGKVLDIIKKEIEENKIDVIATGGQSFQYIPIKEVIKSSKKVDRRIVTIVGGGIITSDPEPAMDALEYADYGVIGEGEATVCELCKVLENNGDFANVNGIIYRDEDSYKITTPRQEIIDIDSIPWPDYDGFEFEKYLLSSPGQSGLNKENTLFMITSRSCPYNCTFCFHTIGKKYRQRSLDKFFEELDYLISRYNIDYICIADELFSVNPERVKEFCKRIKQYNIKWWAQFRVDHITKNPELISVLKDAECNVMSFGLESADNSILKSMRKNTTIEHAEAALKLVYDAGISLEGAFIFGDIEETWETANKTLNWWRNHLEYKINLNLITVYPGTYLYHYACEKGMIKDKVQFLKDGCPQLNVSKLTDKQFSILAREIMESPMILTKKLSEVEAEITDSKTGRIALRGICSVCGERNYWGGVKLFASGFLACAHCGQKYNIVLPEKFRENIDKNIAKLLSKYGKLGAWGINYYTVDLFKRSNALKDAKVYFIDISKIKQRMDLYGKQINPPEVINRENIEAVVISIPAYIHEISEYIKVNFKNVKKVIDICELIDSDYLERINNDEGGIR